MAPGMGGLPGTELGAVVWWAGPFVPIQGTPGEASPPFTLQPAPPLDQETLNWVGSPDGEGVVPPEK